MDVGNIEVEQKLGEVRLKDLIVETSDSEDEDIRIEDMIPKMRNVAGASQEKILDIGVRSIINLKDEIQKPNNFQPDTGINQLLNQYDFFKVSLVAAFMPISGLKFSRGLIRIDLTNEGPSPPVVHSINPLKIVNKVEKNKRFGVSPDLQIAAIKPNINYTSVSVYEEIHPQVIGYFTSESYAKWEYRTTLIIKEIVGSQMMELIVKQPINTPTRAMARVEGELKWADLTTTFLGALNNGTFSAGESAPDFESFTIP